MKSTNNTYVQLNYVTYEMYRYIMYITTLNYVKLDTNSGLLKSCVCLTKSPGPRSPLHVDFGALSSLA